MIKAIGEIRSHNSDDGIVGPGLSVLVDVIFMLLVLLQR